MCPQRSLVCGRHTETTCVVTPSSLVQAHTCRPTRGSEGSESVRVFVLMGAVLVTLFWTC